MKAQVQPWRNGQGGFTLVELIVATAIGLVVMSGLTSLMFTAYRADRQATSRVEAAGEIRSFQQSAIRDFTLSALPAVPATCGTPTQPCTQDLIQLSGCSISSADGTTYVWRSRTVTYSWRSATEVVSRGVGAEPAIPTATNVSAFSWYVDGAPPDQSVVVTIAVTVDWAANTPYTQSQVLRFYPRVVSQVPANVDPACVP